MGEDIDYSSFMEEWEGIFNFIISRSGKLDVDHDELLIPLRAVQRFGDLNHQAVINLNFRESYSIFLQNFELYSEKLHAEICHDYLTRCNFTPSENLLDGDKYNIAIHIRTAMPDDTVGNNNKRWGDFMENPKGYAEDYSAYQYFNLQHNSPIQGHVYYSNLYSALLNKLIAAQRSLSNKPIAVHIFTRGDNLLFEPLISQISGASTVELHNNTRSAETFYWLTRCDSLVCAHSSLSWLASFFNPNQSYMRYPYRHILSPAGVFFDDTLEFSKVPVSVWRNN